MQPYRREVRPAKNPDPQCVHHDAPGAGSILVLAVCFMFMGGLMGFMIGSDYGYGQAVDQGYAKSYKSHRGYK